jgi:hypothetical protein
MDRESVRKIDYWMKANKDAVIFILELSRIIHLWDDLIDKDNPVTPVDINEAFWSLFFILPKNVFYMQNFSTLNPILMAAELNWRTSNELESTGDEEDHRIAFIIRSAYADVIQMSALLCGGREWAYSVSPEIRRWTHAEGFKSYMKNFEKGES